MSYGKVIRYHRRKIIAHKMRVYAHWLLVSALLLVFWCNPYRPVITQCFSELAGCCISTSSQWIGDNPCNIINYAMPVVAWSNQEVKIKSPPEAILSALGFMTRVNMAQPEKILASQMPLLATDNSNSVTSETPVIAKEEKAIPKEKESAITVLDGPPVVAIYNTHTGETYSLTDGVDRLDGKQGGVVKTAAALKERLEQKHKIKVVMTDKIHDKVYNDSYIESEKTVQALIKENPELKMVLDIHRDSEQPRKDSFREINGEKVARIMIVVGSDARAPFPNWQQNLALARQIADKMDELYPGISRGVRVKPGRFNQHYHAGALLMEIGNVQNTTAEAEKAAELLADVLAEVLKEGKE